jgi:hypothetical protein
MRKTDVGRAGQGRAGQDRDLNLISIAVAHLPLPLWQRKSQLTQQEEAIQMPKHLSQLSLSLSLSLSPFEPDAFLPSSQQTKTFRITVQSFDDCPVLSCAVPLGLPPKDVAADEASPDRTSGRVAHLKQCTECRVNEFNKPIAGII